MVRTRRPLVLAMVAMLLVPPVAKATAPQIYASTDPGHSVAFAVERGHTSLLGFDAPSYCGYVKPTENKKPGTTHLLAAPLPMRGGPSGLTAAEDESEMGNPGQLTVTANFSGTNLVGDYRYFASEPSFHCQTGTYYPGQATVPFEAVPFVPSGDPGAATSSADETPIYFSRQGPLEIFVRGEGKTLLVRGAVTSHCRFGGAHRSRRSPFFGVPYSLRTGFPDSFALTRGTNAGRVNGKVVTEIAQLSGTVTEAGIDGRYSRRSVTGKGPHARKCSIGPIRFHADRYLPPAS